MAIPSLPPEVVRYIRRVFASCNRELGLRLARVPNVSEPSLDMALIDHLASFASPVILGNKWAVRIDTHFLGGRRHYYSWEVADIGLLVLIRLGGRIQARKVALLQSKRLFPTNAPVLDDTQDDYVIGFGRLLASDETTATIVRPTRFSFATKSKYESLKSGDAQNKAIQDFEKANSIPVHYLFYNPWDVPSTYQLPLTTQPKLAGPGTAGARIYPSTTVIGRMSSMPKGQSPALSDLAGLVPGAPNKLGWRLEHFVADLVLGCKEGALLANVQDAPFQNLFNRRSGPISAAIAVTIEGPQDRP